MNQSSGNGKPLLEIVIVVSTGAREFVRDCLASIRAHPLRSGEFVVRVTDNASSDGVGAMIREEFPEVSVLELDRNAGFSVGNNRWLERSEAPFVLLLNPDTELLEGGALDRMIEVMEQHPRCAVSGCRLVLRDGSFDHAAKRSFPTLTAAVAHFSGLGRLPGAPDRLAQYRAPELGETEAGEVDSVNGAFMLVRREAIEEVGLLDEGYPSPGLEDLDWCYRFKEAGWTVWYEGTVTVIHVKGAVTVTTRGRRRYRSLRGNLAFHRSMLLFYRQHYAADRNLFVNLAVYAGIALKLIVSLVRSAIGRRLPSRSRPDRR